MFKLFKKRKKGDVIDLVRLQKRGIIPEKKDSWPVTSVSSSDSSSSDASSALGFLGNLANAGSSNQESSSGYNTNPSYDSGSDSSRYLDFSQKKEKLKTRISDIQSRIDQHSNELYDLKNILEVIQKKIARLERKAGVRDFE